LRKLCRHPGLDELVWELLEEVFDAGAPDNHSIIAADLHHEPRPGDPTITTGKPDRA
jgi:hypothetical protein